MTESTDHPRLFAQRVANQAERQGLETQVGGFLAKNAFTDPPEQPRMRCIAKRLIEGDRQNFRRNQDRGAEFQAGQLAQPPKHGVQPVVRQPWNSLVVEKASEDGTMLLLLRNEEFERR